MTKYYSIQLNVVPIQAHNSRWLLYKLNKLMKQDTFKVEDYVDRMFEVKVFMTEEGKEMYEYEKCVYG